MRACVSQRKREREREYERRVRVAEVGKPTTMTTYLVGADHAENMIRRCARGYIYYLIGRVVYEVVVVVVFVDRVVNEQQRQKKNQSGVCGFI